MKTLTAVFVLIVLTVSVSAAPANPPHHKNRRVAMIAGWALHFSQDMRALQRSSLRKREQSHGSSDPQVIAGRRHLRVIRGKVNYFRRVKRSSEGRTVSKR